MTVTEESVEAVARTPLRRIGPALLSLALVAGIFYYLFQQFADVASVWSAVRRMTGLEVGTLVLAAIWNLATYGFVMVATMPGLTYAQAMVVSQASTAVSNTMPAGGAIGIGLNFRMYTSWGFSRSRATVSLLVSGIWNNFAKLGMPVLALALVALQGTPSGGRLAAGLAGIAGLLAAIAIFALMLRSAEGARAFGERAGRVASALLRLVRRPPVHGWERATTKFRARTILLLGARWHWLTLATVVSHLSLYLVLLLALRHVGVSDADVSWAEVLAVFAFARLVTAIPLTPGGVGIVELALIAGLSAAGGPRPEVAAAVLVFRALTYLLPIAVGALAYLVWQRMRSWRRPPGGAPRTPLVPETVEDGDSAGSYAVAPDDGPGDRPATAAPGLGASDRPGTVAPGAGPNDRRANASRGLGASDGPDTVAPGTEPRGAARMVQPAPERAGRHRPDAGWVVAGVVLLLLSAAILHRDRVDGWEQGLFRAINDTLTLPMLLVWPVMQLGNIAAVPALAAAAALLRRFRLAAGILIGGGSTYLLAKVVKDVVTRGRPDALLADVTIHGTAAKGLGFVSGHAGVAAVMATMALPYLGRRGRWVAAGLAGTVCLARVYVGAHLPLDVIGGAGLGVAVGAALHLVLGRPSRTPPLRQPAPAG